MWRKLWSYLHSYLNSPRTFPCNWQQPFLNESAEGRRMTVEIISWSISTKVWDRAGIELATPGSAVRHASVARHVTDCATWPGNVKTNQRGYYNLLNSAFWGWLSMESQPQNPEFRINPENFHPCIQRIKILLSTKNICMEWLVGK